ncbi:MAG TPA: conjugal transfer protein TraR, partial [Pseudomonas sp.]|nr:conjugal transfer protein TraR [Pseudomonas sp.]
MRLQALAIEYATRAEAIERDLSRTHAQSFSEQATER